MNKLKTLKECFDEMLKVYNFDEIKEYLENEVCESCDNKGYLEVTCEDSKEYIQACDNCNYIGNDKDERAIEAALKDGYTLTKKGRIL